MLREATAAGGVRDDRVPGRPTDQCGGIRRDPPTLDAGRAPSDRRRRVHRGHARQRRPHGERLGRAGAVGVARSVTDFHYACYLSDLAVDARYQGTGIGRELVRLTRRSLGPRCSVRLISAPAAMSYYPKIGFAPNERCWEIAPLAEEERRP